MPVEAIKLTRMGESARVSCESCHTDWMTNPESRNQDIIGLVNTPVVDPVAVPTNKPRNRATRLIAAFRK